MLFSPLLFAFYALDTPLCRHAADADVVTTPLFLLLLLMPCCC